MSTEWFLHKEGSQFGPYTWDQLCTFAREGRVQPGDNVWNSSMTAWAPAQEVAGLIPQQPLGEQKEDGTPRAQVGADGEEILGFVPAVTKKTGLLRSKTYTIVVTNKRLIFAELTNEMLKEAASQAIEETKGKGLFARMKETAASQQRVYGNYTNMAPAEILVQNRDNFAIGNDEIKTVKVSIGHMIDDGHQDSDRMFINTSREKMKLRFNYHGGTGAAKKILWRALGKKVK